MGAAGLTSFNLARFVDEEENGIKELVVEEFVHDFVGKSDQASVYDCLALVLSVGDVVVELHNAPQKS